MRIYMIDARVTIPVVADNDVDAEEIARDHIRDEVDADILNKNIKLISKRVTQVGEHGADGDIIPWGNGDNQTIQELLGE